MLNLVAVLLLQTAVIYPGASNRQFPPNGCDGTTFVKGDGSCGTPSAGGLPSGLIIMTLTSCPTGFTEEASLNGKFVLGTLAANGNTGTTGGVDSVTPQGTNSIPTFTGSALSTHTHTFSGNQLATHAHELPFQLSSTTATRQIAAATFGTGTSRAATGASAAGSSNTTSAAVALSQAVTAGTPAGTNTATSAGTPAGTVTAPTFTGVSQENRPAFIRVVFCKAN